MICPVEGTLPVAIEFSLAILPRSVEQRPHRRTRPGRDALRVYDAAPRVHPAAGRIGRLARAPWRRNKLVSIWCEFRGKCGGTAARAAQAGRNPIAQQFAGANRTLCGVSYN